MEEIRPGIGEFDFKAGGKVPRMIRLGVWRADALDEDEDDSGRNLETVGVEAKVEVDAVLEKPTPSVSRRRVSNSAVSQNRSSSVKDDRTE
jgi:hypothetical protein